MATTDAYMEELGNDDEILESPFTEIDDDYDDVKELDPENDFNYSAGEDADDELDFNFSDDDSSDDRDLFDEVLDDSDVLTDLTINKVNEIISDNMYIKSKGNRFKYIFDEILAKYWFFNVLSEDDQDDVDMNMFYRWLNTEKFASKFDDNWKDFMLGEGYGDEIVDLYESNSSDESTSEEEEDDISNSINRKSDIESTISNKVNEQELDDDISTDNTDDTTEADDISSKFLKDDGSLIDLVTDDSYISENA